MKFRSGFVSNSSSSSFIMGFAVVSDLDKVKKWMDETGIDLNIELMSYLENKYDAPAVYGSVLRMENFNGGILEIDTKNIDLGLTEDAHAKALLTYGTDPYVVWFSESGGEPSWDEEREEYDYDVDLDFFGDKEVKLYKAFTEGTIPGIVSGQASFGAGRDG